MKTAALLLVLALFPSGTVRAQYRYAYPEDIEPAARPEETVQKHVPRYFHYYYSAAGGLSSPMGGAWGGGTAGFKPAASISFAAGKKIDEALSYGLETSYEAGHQSRSVDGLKLNLFSFTPFLRASSVRGAGAYYATVGAGAYHWSQPAFGEGALRRPSDSGSSFGINLGIGALYPFGGAMRIGLDLRWHHVFSVSAANFDTDTVNNVHAALSICYGFVDIP